MTNLRDMPMIGQREERGYLVLQLSGMIDRDVHTPLNGGNSVASDLKQYVRENPSKPVALI